MKKIDLTSEELIQKEQDVTKAEQEKIVIEQEKQDAINKKASAKQKLIDLGLTEEEIKLTFGV